MLLKVRGHSHQIKETIVGRITRNQNFSGENQILIYEGSSPAKPDNFRAILTSLSRVDLPLNQPSVYSVQTLDHLAEGDIIVINPDGIINTLYRVQSHQNFILATERCNSNCLMCSQPPRDRDDIPYIYNVLRQMIPLIPKGCPELGITGGEPTLLGEKFFSLLELIQSELPDSEVHCLTNGRSFAWPGMAKRLGSLQMRRLMLGIPLYADYSQLHDYIVQAKHAFNQTMQGLYNLAFNEQRIEIRIVLHRQSIPRLVKLSRYIYKNLPFVEHIAFMGLECQGYTPYNLEKLWIDPVDYMDELGEAITFLSDRGMNVSIYNSQLCLIPRNLWKFNKKSISDWKNIFVEECSECAIIEKCGGLFASCAQVHSQHLAPFLADPENSPVV